LRFGAIGSRARHARVAARVIGSARLVRRNAALSSLPRAGPLSARLIRGLLCTATRLASPRRAQAAVGQPAALVLTQDPGNPAIDAPSAFIAIEKHIGQWIVIRVHRPTSRAYVPLADTLLDGDERRPSSPCLGAIDLPPRGFALSDRFGTADGGALTDVAYLAADGHLSASVAPRVHWG